MTGAQSYMVLPANGTTLFHCVEFVLQRLIRHTWFVGPLAVPRLAGPRVKGDGSFGIKRHKCHQNSGCRRQQRHAWCGRPLH